MPKLVGTPLWIGALAIASAGCAYGSDGRGGRDAGVVHGQDSGIARFDAGVRIDAGPGIDAGRPPGIDAGPPRDSGSCTESPCRLVSPQCGCGAGEGCSVSGSGARGCSAAGTALEGQACTGPSSCQAGMLCIGAGGAQAFCARFCNRDADCTGGPGSLCLLTLDDGSGGALPGVTLCTVSCNATSSAGCGAGMACAVLQESSGAMRWLTSCRAAGTATTGGACSTDDDCAPGHFCADAGFGNECIRYCTYPSGFECSFGSCNAFTTPVIVGGTEYGYCY